MLHTKEIQSRKGRFNVGSVIVDQIGTDGELIEDADTTLTNPQKDQLLLDALPGAASQIYAGVRIVRFGDQIVLKKQITHLGNPWPAFKKRIQIPKSWLEVERQASSEGLVTRFVGIYNYGAVTIFVDFDPSTYLRGKANNSAAHVSTNDLHQAQVLGQFSRADRNGNRLTSVRADAFRQYLQTGYELQEPRIDVFRQFNQQIFAMGRIDALTAVQHMHHASWPDTFQSEWAGFYLEFLIDVFIKSRKIDHLVQFQRIKQKGYYDYDLVFKSGMRVEYYGDLKASDSRTRESPGNDAEDIRRCVRDFGRFWYVIYEHDTTHGRNGDNLSTVAWNEWKRSAGHNSKKTFDPLSYAGKFKESVRFVRMSILELNETNLPVVLKDFTQGRQQGGASRAMKVMIKKKNIDNFLIYTESLAEAKSQQDRGEIS